MQSVTQQYIDRLVTAYPCITQIWLIGSRANNTHRPDSDWDYLVWADDNRLFDVLNQDTSFHDSIIDLLIVIDDEWFAKPWLEPDGLRKKGEVYGPDGLRWQRTSATEAQYTEAREAEPGSFYVKTQVVKALLKYRRAK